MKSKTMQTPASVSYEQVDSIVSSEVVLSGDITAGGSLRFEGTLKGNITLSGNLIIGRNSYVQGDIKATNIHIIGTVDGNVSADQLKLLSTGRLNGDASVRTIIIDEGAVFNGRCHTVTVEDKEPDINDILNVID